MPAKIIYSEEQKQELIDLYVNQRISISKIVESGKFPGSEDVIRRNLHSWGINSMINPGSTISDFQKEIVEPWLNGESLNNLSKQYHTNKSTLSKKLKDLGYEVINKHNALKIDETVFDVIDTEEKAYWLGFLYADGNISSITDPTKKTQYRVTINLKESDSNHLRKFNKFIGHINDNVKFNKGGCGSDIQCHWQINNQHLWESLNRLGCVPNKSLIITFPNEEIFTSKFLIRHFLRGYFDGDGCITYNKRKYDVIPRLSVLGTKDFIENFQKITECYNSPIQELCTKNYYNLKCNVEDSRKLMHYLYDNCSIYLDRKYKRFLLLDTNPTIKEFERLDDFE